MSAVVLLMGQSSGDHARGIALSYRQAFEKLGHEFIEIYLPDQAKAVQQLQELPRRDVVLAYSSMAFGNDIALDIAGGGSVNMWQALRIPYIGLYGDSPAYYFSRHMLPGAWHVGLYGFREHLKLRRTLPRGHGALGLHPVVRLNEAPRDTIDFRAKQSGPVVILKNGRDPDASLRLWRERLPRPVAAVLLELAAELRARVDDADVDIDALLLQAFRAHDYAADEFLKLRLFCVAMLDDYWRRYKSTEVVKSLLDQPVVLYGDEWAHVDFTGRRLRYIPNVDYAASNRMIREALAIIDMAPNTQDAPHDRPLRAFGAHTLCLTNEQRFFRTRLPHADHCLYRFGHNDVCARVDAVLANPGRAVEMGDDIAAAFAAAFPADAMARCMLEWAQMIRFNLSAKTPDGVPGYCVWPPDSLAV